MIRARHSGDYIIGGSGNELLLYCTNCGIFSRRYFIEAYEDETLNIEQMLNIM